MARSRNLKPGLFVNEQVASCSWPARWLFPALWTLADRDGRLEDRPLRIKAQVFPFDNVDVDALLGELAAAELIRRYEVDGEQYVWIPKFAVHQNPHKKEAKSAIPAHPWDSAPTKVGSSPVKVGASRVKVGASPADSLSSDSLLSESLISESLCASPPPTPPRGETERGRVDDEPKSGAKPRKSGPPTDPDRFAEFWAVYPRWRRSGKQAARRAWGPSVARAKAEGHGAAHIVERAQAFADAASRWPESERQFVPLPATWLNGDRWDDDPSAWERKAVGKQVRAETAEERCARNVEAAKALMRAEAEREEAQRSQPPPPREEPPPRATCDPETRRRLMSEYRANRNGVHQ